MLYSDLKMTTYALHFRLARAHHWLRILLLAGAAISCCGLTPAAEKPVTEHTGATIATDSTAVKISARREGDQTHFFVENNELCEITMTFDLSLVNLKGEVQFPYTATFPPGKTVEAFTLTPEKIGARWEYSYTNYYKLGSNCARHDDNYVYELPYAAGEKFKVTQAYNGTFSHKGSNKYAIDWKMNEGTYVHAARGGLVVKTKDDSETGGSSMKFDKFNNYVLIRHDDGTLGHYCHLQKGGVCVHPGDRVVTGQIIAKSGNTGFSSGPHLHFCVFKTRNGRERDSIPIQFRTGTEKSATLMAGKTYRAADVQNAKAILSPSPALTTVQ
jgi:murein DD-endopeptidase MepM/ murein hydrolase activator NlpD